MYDTFQLILAVVITMMLSAVVFDSNGQDSTENKAHRAYCESIEGVPAHDGCVVGDKFVKLPKWMVEAGLVE